MLLLPPFIIDGLKAIKCVPAGKWGNIITQLGRTARLLRLVVVCTACLWGAMPLAIAAFTAVQPLAVSKLEPELQEELKAKNYTDANVYFDRGV